MKDLPFLKIERWKEGEEKKYEKKIENLKKEKKLNGYAITEIIEKKLKNDFLIKKERNYSPEAKAPYDLVIGDEDELRMIGFEIKGDTDNFSRLKDQLNEYIFAFDGVYLVLHKKKEPEWLPDFVGVIRVFEDEDVYIEKHSYIWDFLGIGSVYDWEALFKSNSLGITSKKTREILDIIKDVRRNIMFNRFFAVQDGYNTYRFSKFYPFTDVQKAVLIGFDVPYHFKLLKKDIIDCEKRLNNIKEIVALGEKGQKQL